MTVHRPHPPSRAMRENPNIDQLRRQARELLEAYRAQSPDAVLEVGAYHRNATLDTFGRQQSTASSNMKPPVKRGAAPCDLRGLLANKNRPGQYFNGRTFDTRTARINDDPPE